MKLRINLTLVLGIVAVGLVIYQVIVRRASPWYVIVLLLLFAGRYFARRGEKKREQLLKEVPHRPLGLSDDDSNRR